MLSVGVIMTAHNRVRMTVACVRSLKEQVAADEWRFTVYLTDDGSSDGTAAAVRAELPTCRIIEGTGTLFWNQGMRLAFAEALRDKHDFYLWLNDDVVLHNDAISLLLETYYSTCNRTGDGLQIVVGAVRWPGTEVMSYGGYVRKPKWYNRCHLEHCSPAREVQEIDSMNGNCVLIPASVAKLVGSLEARFHHGLGDLDYGLRAKRLGCRIWQAPGFAGECAGNSPVGTWTDARVAIRRRLRMVREPKGVPPREWLVFVRRHSGAVWPLALASPYVKWFVVNPLRELLKGGGARHAS